MRVGWAPALEDAARLVGAWARSGDLVLTVGAGDLDGAGGLVREALG
jgi:UDP-N-acetylmuramate-alanine ligase